jgi:hypothetical protein
MLTNKIKINYMASVPEKPIIIYPINDSDWIKSYDGFEFKWIHNGKDLQMGYRFQLFNIPFKDLGKNSSWFTETSINNSLNILNEFASTQYGCLEIVGNNDLNDLTITDTKQFKDRNGSFLQIDGKQSGEGIYSDNIYIWRIQTKGFLSSDWSPWSNGLLRIDEGNPVIKGVSSESSYKGNPIVSSISDLSSPFMYNKRRDGKIDIGFDKRNGLYIYYDYKDESVILRCSGNPDEQKRYYGMISFNMDFVEEGFEFKGFTGPDGNMFYPHEVVDSMYTYTIERNTDDGLSSWNGASEQITFINELKK